MRKDRHHLLEIILWPNNDGTFATKGDRNPMYRKNAWAIACSRKTPEQIEATRKSKSEKMKKYWKEKRQKKEVMPV